MTGELGVPGFAELGMLSGVSLAPESAICSHPAKVPWPPGLLFLLTIWSQTESSQLAFASNSFT